MAPPAVRRMLAVHRHQHETQCRHLDELGGDADLVGAFEADPHIDEVSEHGGEEECGR